MKSFVEYINEQKLLEAKVATNFEAFITVAYNGGIKRDKQTLAGAGLSEDDYNEYKKEAQSIARALKGKFKTGKMVHYGSDNAQMVDWWTGKGTPKTDNYIGKAHLSLKQAKGSQLMSAKKGEAISTFKAAVAYMGKHAPKDSDKLAKKISRFMKEVVMPKGGPTIGEFTTAVKENKSIGKALKALADQYLTASDKRKKMTIELNDYFSTNSEFSRWFTYEAATGETKFGPEPLAMANWVLKFSTDGRIQELEPLSRGGKPTKYIDKLSKKVHYRFSWKTPSSRGTKTYMALRGDIREAKTLDELIGQECQSSSYLFLNEGIFDNITKAYQKMKTFFTQLIEKIINAISAAAKRGMDSLLEFLGVEISNVSVTGLSY